MVSQLSVLSSCLLRGRADSLRSVNGVSGRGSMFTNSSALCLDSLVSTWPKRLKNESGEFVIVMVEYARKV